MYKEHYCIFHPNLKTKSKYFFFINYKSCILLGYNLRSSAVSLPLKINATHLGVQLTGNSLGKQIFSWKILIHCIFTSNNSSSELLLKIKTQREWEG